MTFLNQALAVAEALEDPVVKASVLSNLGAALTQTDPKAAVDTLKKSVDIREKEVRKGIARSNLYVTVK